MLHQLGLHGGLSFPQIADLSHKLMKIYIVFPKRYCIYSF